ncbi:MAG: hypothetical protein JO056_01775 [Alphaproteobacteria bacterium]|nr:hypothetical protein [Alphaproteobacteria bacterium]
MLTTSRQGVNAGNAEIIRLARNDAPLSVKDVLAGWREDLAFRQFFIAELAAAGYRGFFWELPRVESGRLSDAFECALVRGDTLAEMKADDSDFAEYLNATTEPVVAFRNLGHDALLIAPRRISDADCYGHMAAFVRKAPREQQHALLRCVAEETERLLGVGHQFWISTSGLGVPWLHVRLDTDPKYYQYRPYADAA